MKTALYRKYRPRFFRDVIGQDAVSTALKNQIASGRFGHSYIFTGIRGTGKTTFARILAKAINCPNAKDGEPCGVCDICRGIDDGTMLDVTETDAASNSGVDSIRELRDETAFAPGVCRYRVYIIDEAHMLSKEAWAALLKIMEEPPEHVVFILATTEIHKVPATILSRCQRYELRRIPREAIAASLMRIAGLERIDLKEDGAAQIARLSDGAMRDALSLLETAASLGQAIDAEAVSRLAGVADKSGVAAIVNSMLSGDIPAVLAQLRSMYERSADPARLCYDILRRCRDLLAFKLAGKEAFKDSSAQEISELEEACATLDTDKILAVMDELASATDKLGTSPDRTLTLELALIRVCNIGHVNAFAPQKPTAGPAIQTQRPSAPPQFRAPSVQNPAPTTPQQRPVPEISAHDSATSKNAAPAGDDAPPWDVPAEEPRQKADDKDAREEEPHEDAVCEDDDLFANIKQAAEQKKTEPAQPQKAPEIEIDGFPAPAGFENYCEWGRVLQQLSTDPFIYTYIKGARAYRDGPRLLIDGGRMHLAAGMPGKIAEIESAIREVTGESLRVSEYKATEEKTEQDPATAEMDDIFSRAERNNITIEEIKFN